MTNPLVPAAEKAEMRAALWPAYSAFAAAADCPRASLDAKVECLNAYKARLDLQISRTAHLARNDGQLQLSSSVMEEFLWRIFVAAGSEWTSGLDVACQANVACGLSLDCHGRVSLTEKTADFALLKRTTLRSTGSDAVQTSVGVAVVECKTNLDSTMLREMCTFASDMGRLVPSSRVFVVCDWLDMPPAPLPKGSIERIFVLRGKRSDVRRAKRTSTTSGGGGGGGGGGGSGGTGQEYAAFLASRPVRADVVGALVDALRHAARCAAGDGVAAWSGV